MTNFEYDRLPTPTSFRLLQRVEHPYGEKSYRLHTFELADAPAFEALSYTWGNPFSPDSREYSQDFSSKYEIEVNGATFKVRSNLYWALVHLGSEKIVSKVIPHSNGKTALHLAAQTGDDRKVTALLKAGARIAARDEDGNTALHFAAENGHFGIVQQLTAPERVSQYLSLVSDYRYRHTPAEAARKTAHIDDSHAATYKYLSSLSLENDKFEGFWWIDAICINQNDLGERAAQVRLMSQIYTNAHHLAVWLGTGGNGGLLSMQGFGPDGSGHTALPRNMGDVMEVFKLRWFSRMWIVQELVLARDVTFHASQRLDYASFNAAVRAMATDTSLSDLRDRDTRLGRLAIRQAEHLRKLRERYQSKDPESLPLYTLIFECASGESMEPQDKIYSLLNLVKNSDGEFEPPMDVDYKKPVEEVYTTATRHILMEAGDLSPLSWSTPTLTPRKSAISNLPSWVPAFNAFHVTRTPEISLDPRALSSGGGFAPRCFRACGSLRTSLNEQAFEGPLPTFSPELQLHGYRIDALHLVGDPVDTTDIVRFPPHWLDLTASLSLNYPTGEPLAKALMLTALTGKYNSTSALKPNTRPAVWQDAQAAWIELVRASLATPPLSAPQLTEIDRLARNDNDDSGNATSKVAYWPPGGATAIRTEPDAAAPGPERTVTDRSRDFSRRNPAAPPPAPRFPGALPDGPYAALTEVLSNAWLHRALFVTTSGYLGLGPAGIKPGDEVWLLPGSTVPMLLRRRANDGEAVFGFIGEAYVHGVMFGERAAEAGKTKAQEIVLV